MTESITNRLYVHAECEIGMCFDCTDVWTGKELIVPELLEGYPADQPHPDRVYCPRCGNVSLENAVLKHFASCALGQSLLLNQGCCLVEVGDYVLATKYTDGDPGDAWCLGFYAGEMPRLKTHKNKNIRHLVYDSNGQSMRLNGFRRVGHIREDVGRWLLEVAPYLAGCPPGTINLWTMLTFESYKKGESQ